MWGIREANLEALPLSSQAYRGNVLNQYLTANGTGLIYDMRGNLTNDGTWTYAYDLKNHLVSASRSGSTANYAYDALGRRARKAVNGVRTYYISMGDQEVAEYDNGGNPSRRYVYGLGLDEPLAMVNTAGQHSYHLTDALGSVIGLLDDTGALIEKHAYTAYGRTLGGSSTPFLYAGRRLDDETGLYHNRARAYSPVLGRFLQEDPLSTDGGLNLYAYVKNDPTNNTDPSGLVLFPGIKPVYAQGGTAEQRARVMDSVDQIFSTPRGAELKNIIEGPWYWFGSPKIINIVDSNSADSGSYIPRLDMSINPDWHPNVATSEGIVPASTTRMVAHELGHIVTGIYDDGVGNMNNVIANENPIMNYLGGPSRTSYGAWLGQGPSGAGCGR
jgi:RHS repeat-associated protein